MIYDLCMIMLLKTKWFNDDLSSLVLILFIVALYLSKLFLFFERGNFYLIYKSGIIGLCHLFSLMAE